jgi:hypothetical protein
VLGTQRVAGFDAAILEADDAASLAKWLVDHGYAFRPQLEAWLKTYIANKWKITAFKIATDAPSKGLGSSAVRMTFATDRPFFPYREPTDQQERQGVNRTLRVFFVAPWRSDGAIGDGAKPWPGITLHAAPMADAATLLAGALASAAIPQGAWLTYHLDRSSPRPATDELYFSQRAEQEEKHIPPIVDRDVVRVPVFLDLWLFAGIVVFFIVRMRRKQSA